MISTISINFSKVIFVDLSPLNINPVYEMILDNKPVSNRIEL